MACAPTTESTTRVGTDHRAGSDHRATFEDRAGEQPHIGLELDGRVDVGAIGIDHRDALAHPAGVDALTQLGLRGRELDAVVDAEHFGGVGLHRVNRVSRAAQHLDRVGEVVLALHVLGAQPAQRGCEQVATEAVDRGVDLVDRAFLVRRVGLLDDAIDAAVRVAQHPPVAVDVGRSGREDRGRRVGDPVLGRERGKSLGTQQRRVAGHDDEVVFGVEVVERAPH